MERITATIEDKIMAQVRRRAGRRGVSAFIQQAVREKLQREGLLAVLDELDAEYGAPSAEIVAEVDAEARRLLKPEVRPKAGRQPEAPKKTKARR